MTQCHVYDCIAQHLATVVAYYICTKRSAAEWSLKSDTRGVVGAEHAVAYYICTKRSAAAWSLKSDRGGYGRYRACRRILDFYEEIRSGMVFEKWQGSQG